MKPWRWGGGGAVRWMYGQTDGQTDSPCVLQDFIPFGAAAQKASSPVFPKACFLSLTITIIESRVTGIAVHILSLRFFDWFLAHILVSRPWNWQTVRGLLNRGEEPKMHLKSGYDNERGGGKIAPNPDDMAYVWLVITQPFSNGFTKTWWQFERASKIL